MPAPTITPKYRPVLEAMKHIQSETDLWSLADALLKAAPQGEFDLQRIIDEATDAGVIGKLKMSTLRQYRDSARLWPNHQRVDGVSFTAHKEMQRLPGGAVARRRLLKDMETNLGSASKVTVAEVKKTLNSKGIGKAQAATKKQQSVTRADLQDIMAGSPKLIAAVGRGTPANDLDLLVLGTKKFLGHLEQLQIVAHRKAAKAAKKAARTPVAAPAPAAPAAPATPAPAKQAAPSAAHAPKKSMRGL